MTPRWSARGTGTASALLFAVAVGAAGCGPTPEHPEVAEQLLRRADLDGSGAVDAAEFASLALPDQGFAPFDLDHDGQLDATELERAFLDDNPASFQERGRQGVHRRFGHPFERPGGQVEGRGKAGRGGGHRGKGKRGHRGTPRPGEAPPAGPR